MGLKNDIGRIKHFLVRKKWIIPSKAATGLLYAVVKREGAEPIKKAVNHLVQTGYKVEHVNDISSKITILYLSSLCKNLPELRDKKAETQKLLDGIIKDVLND